LGGNGGKSFRCCIERNCAAIAWSTTAIMFWYCSHKPRLQRSSNTVFGPVAAIQRLSDLGHTMLAAAIAQLGQLQRVTLAGQDGANDLQASDAGDVAEHLG
jgi:hypothetical protein